MHRSKLLSHSQSGATLIEIVVVLPIVLFLTLAGVELLRYSYHIACAQFLASEGLRRAVIGTVATPAPIQSAVIDRANVMGIQLTAADVAVCRAVDNTNPGTPLIFACGTIGTQDDWVQIRINYPLPLVIGGNLVSGYSGVTRMISAQATGKREPR